jgi:hypothetical protein
MSCRGRPASDQEARGSGAYTTASSDLDVFTRSMDTVSMLLWTRFGFDVGSRLMILRWEIRFYPVISQAVQGGFFIYVWVFRFTSLSPSLEISGHSWLVVEVVFPTRCWTPCSGLISFARRRFKMSSRSILSVSSLPSSASSQELDLHGRVPVSRAWQKPPPSQETIYTGTSVAVTTKNTAKKRTSALLLHVLSLLSNCIANGKQGAGNHTP